MKKQCSSLRNLAVGLFWLAGLVPLAAQFDSGSDGSFGAIDILTDTTLQLPADGVFHATTVNIASGATLTFSRNAFNTPVYILATGDVSISGRINVSGKNGNNIVGGEGGPGGFDGGNPGSSGVEPGDGAGPGGGLAGTLTRNADGAGSGSYGSTATAGSSIQTGDTYGSPLLIPMIGGSGGGGSIGTPGIGGGGGGGALLIASNTEIELASTGQIWANGSLIFSSSVYNGGSGGSIRLIAPKVRGSGQVRALSVFTNANSLSGSIYAGVGRIRIDTTDRSELSFDFDPPGFTSVGSNMVVFPAPLPRLDIVEVAGTNITVGTDSAVFVDLPFNADPNRTITVRAENFDKVVHYAIVLQPANGDRIVVTDSIDNASGNPATTTTNVTFPLNTQTRVHVWTIPDPAP